MRFKKVTIGGQSRVIDLARAASTLISGNFQSYYPGSGAYSSFTGMWGVFVPTNTGLTFTASQRVTSSYPAGTVFNWNNVTPDARYTGINGYLHIDYGNYDASPGSITPKQVSALTACSLTANWVFSGDASSGLLSEIWLTDVSAASGSLSKQYEVGFLPKMSAGSLAFATGLPAVGTGSFTVNGVRWDVGQSTGGAQPYLVAFRHDHANHQGTLPYLQYLQFLVTSGIITGNEWVNGIGFGVEPLTGTGSLLITSLTGNVA